MLGSFEGGRPAAEPLPENVLRPDLELGAVTEEVFWAMFGWRLEREGGRRGSAFGSDLTDLTRGSCLEDLDGRARGSASLEGRARLVDAGRLRREDDCFEEVEAEGGIVGVCYEKRKW